MNLCQVDICQTPVPRQLCRIRPQDFLLSNCGVPTPPSTARYIELYRVFIYSVLLGAAGSGTDILFDEKKSVDSNADFWLHKITPVTADGSQPVDYFMRVQWPSGRYTSNVLQDVQTVLGVMYTKDSNGQTQPVRIPAGRSLGIQLQNFTNAAVPVSIAFEGVNRFFIQ